jgi:CP family cyanate transporter-like MFS transporter
MGRSRLRTAAFPAALVFVAFNLRLIIASLGPELEHVRAGLGLSSAETSLLTALPVFCFGVLALAGPWLAHRLGLRRTLLTLLLLMLAGTLLRVGPDVATLFAGTFLAAAGIAVANVLMPVLARQEFPRHTGAILGLTTMATLGSVAAAAGLTVPLADATGAGWRGGLGIWAAVTLLAVLAWWPFAARQPATADVELAHVTVALLRTPLAWMVTLFFGLISFNVYVVVNWLPTLYADHGYSHAAAGALVSVNVLVQLPEALLVPSIASRMRNQYPIVVAVVLLTAVGFLGILLSPTSPAVLWVAILGLGQGTGFPLALTFLVVRSRTHAETVQLSTLMQSVGYVVAGVGPLVVGALHAATHSWRGPLVLLLVLLVPELVCGLRAASPGFLDLGRDPPEPAMSR